MYNKIKKLNSILLALLILFGCFYISVAAADSSSVISFKISDDGFAILSDCDEGASGVIEIPSEVIINGESYKVKYIGNKAFDECYFITEIKIPEGVTVIGNHAFRDCVSLEALYVPESLIVCQYDAFDGCFDVTVYCYKSNYQFFGLAGMSANIKVNIIDGETEDENAEESTPVSSNNFAVRFIEALKKMINSIIEYFNADDDFSFDLPFDLPFDITV